MGNSDSDLRSFCDSELSVALRVALFMTMLTMFKHEELNLVRLGISCHSATSVGFRRYKWSNPNEIFMSTPILKVNPPTPRDTNCYGLSQHVFACSACSMILRHGSWQSKTGQCKAATESDIATRSTCGCSIVTAAARLAH